MMRSFKKTAVAFALAGVLTGLSGCSYIASVFGLSGTYSFTGANIPDAASTFSVAYIANSTPEFPTLATALTEGLRDRFIRQTRLSMVSEGGDLAFEGDIVTAVEAPATIEASDRGQDAGSTRNRMTVTVQMMFTNEVQPDLSFQSRQSFSAYVDYNVTDRPSADNQLVENLVEILVENIFNAAVAQQW
ncbi:MAG: LPS assembly lipoprotein LptE [Alistipes sp.]|jgi:hypothetical protein|nr:LPS assembly lipoprotein LptE [Alistipes sp.]